MANRPVDVEGFLAALDHPRKAEIVALLKTGVVDRHGALAVASGPMGEVVLRSTQHLSDADLGAMAAYLKTLGAGSVAAAGSATPGASALWEVDVRLGAGASLRWLSRFDSQISCSRRSTTSAKSSAATATLLSC